MIMARPPSSPLAAYNSSPLSNNAHLLPTSEGDSTSMPWQGSTVASCSTSPLASSPVPSRGPSASTLRRSQYKSRSSATSNVPSSPLSRWHDRLLQNCAQRVKKDRAKSRAGSRGGLIEQESQEPLTEEEQMMVRKLWRREMERRQEQLEDDWENQQLGIIDEKDIEELDGAQDDFESIPPDVEEMFMLQLQEPNALDSADNGMMLDEASESSILPPPSRLDALLLANPCPNCSSTPLTIENMHIGCHSCGWSISPQVLQTGQAELEMHWAQRDEKLHHLGFTYSPAVGTVASCSCGEILVLE